MNAESLISATLAAWKDDIPYSFMSLSTTSFLLEPLTIHYCLFQISLAKEFNEDLEHLNTSHYLNDSFIEKTTLILTTLIDPFQDQISQASLLTSTLLERP